MNTELLTFIGVSLTCLGLFIKIYHRHLSKKRTLKLTVNYGRGFQEETKTSYLAMLLTITNTSEIPVVFGGIHALDPKGEIYYPSCSIPGKTQIGSSDYITCYIPAGHLLNPKAKKIWVIDGGRKKHQLPNKILKKALLYLEKEQTRLSDLGLK